MFQTTSIITLNAQFCGEGKEVTTIATLALGSRLRQGLAEM
jgi:hypothetical protein